MKQIQVKIYSLCAREVGRRKNINACNSHSPRNSYHFFQSLPSSSCLVLLKNVAKFNLNLFINKEGSNRGKRKEYRNVEEPSPLSSFNVVNFLDIQKHLTFDSHCTSSSKTR